ncbi:MAG TPA: dienelactone hydrolase family protein, partial [Symbiobacteriaceae bacterium]|nr:dienelactone hydrolase family protein [Symbiobacteriaceae bacterium]
RAKDWGAYTSWGRLAACRGLVGITFNHRSTHNRTRMADACGDVEAALAYVRANAGALGVDPDRLCFWVCSAGGFKLKVVLEHNPAYVRCAVAYYPLLDLPDSPEVSLIRYVSPQAAPLLLVRAGCDHAVLNAGVDRFVQAALAQNMHLDLYNHPAGEHAFDIRNANERSREIIAHTLDFMVGHLRAHDSQ